MSGTRPLPRRVSGLALWFRPESLAGTANGAAVASWPDDSGNGRHAVQATGANQPTYTASLAAHNSRPGVTFAGSHWLKATGITGFSSAITVFVVATITGTTNTGIFELNTGAVNTGPQMFADAGTSNKIAFRIPSGGSKTASSTRTIPATAIWGGNHDGVTNYVRWQDWPDASIAAGAWTTPSPSQFNVGSSGGQVYPMTGTISEIIVYNRNLTDAERRLVAQYLAGKYALPVAWNAPNGSKLTTPTPDATGSVVHPDVLDFLTQYGISSWHGYRYYMLVTPFSASNVAVENPCLLASNDGLTWVNAPNVTNPIDPRPGSDHNNDPELDYDSVNDLLLCYYSDETAAGSDHWCVRTYDGTTVSAETVLATSTAPGGKGFASAAVWQVGVNWYCVCNEYKNDPNQYWMYTATNPLGPWTRSQQVTINNLPAGKEDWHHDIIRDPRDGTLYMALSVQVQNVWADHRLCLAISTDNGLTWQCSKELMTTQVPGGVQNTKLYRASMVLSADGTQLRIWYSAVGTSTDWFCYYAELPVGLAGAA